MTRAVEFTLERPAPRLVEVVEGVHLNPAAVEAIRPHEVAGSVVLLRSGAELNVAAEPPAVVEALS